MPPAKLPPCKICQKKDAGRYRCPVDHVDYCSVICFKAHKADGCAKDTPYQPPPLPLIPAASPDDKTSDERPRKRLKDLRWPPEPNPALWDDPLSRDDVKPLRGFEFEAIATSPEVRVLLASPELRGTLSRLADLQPRSARETSLRLLMGLPTDPASATYRPEPSKRFSTGVQSVSAVEGSSRNGGSGHGGRGGGRGRGRGGRGGSAAGGRGGRSGPDEGLLHSTPEERADVAKFAEAVQVALQNARQARGERRS